MGRKSSLAPLPNCSVTVAPTHDNGGGLLAVIQSTSVLDILGSNSKTVASIEVYYSDILTSNSQVSANQVTVGYVADKINAVSKVLKIIKISANKADVTITEKANGKEIKSTSCRVKVN